MRVGRALTFPQAAEATPRLAGAVTERIWACVSLQWEWLGGEPPLRRATVVGGGERGRAVSGLLAAAGLERPRRHSDRARRPRRRRPRLLRHRAARPRRRASPPSATSCPLRTGVLVVGDVAARPSPRRAGARPRSTLDGDEPSLDCPDRAFARALQPLVAAAGERRERRAA